MSEGNPIVPGSFAPGSNIAGYLLEEQIGQGGMAVVFRAHDERLDRTVALKILAPALAADEAFRQRFIRESRAAAAVDDPHIIPVFEAGEASGVLFIAMRYVRGGDVRSLVTQFGPLPPGRVAEIVSQVASALDAAHGRGLVHRDVKPANMLLDSSSGAGRPDHVYLSDFGLSKGSLQASGLTGTGTFLGTLDYISPEQIEGKPVDGRADEYALACAAFELLTGVPPFQRDEAMAVMYAQLSEPPPPVTTRRPDVPVPVNAVFARALAKAPADRYLNCREFSDALREAFGIRPYDSGPGQVPSGEHPGTRVVQHPGTDPGRSGTQLAGAGSGGWSGSGGSGGQPPTSAWQGSGGQPQGDWASGGQPPSGQQGGGWAGGPGGSGPSGGDFGGPATQLAGSAHGTTSPDLTAAHLQSGSGAPGGPGGYGYGDGGGRGGSRPFWRSPVALVVLVLVLVLAGGGVAYEALKGGSSTPPAKQRTLTAPGCSTKTAAGPTLARAKGTMVPVQDSNPFGLEATPDGKFLFVVNDTSVQAYGTGPGGQLTYKWQYTIANSPEPATGSTLTNNGKYMLVAAANGIVVLSVAQGEAGDGSMQVGTLTVPNLTKYERAIQVAVSPDDKFAFVTLQFANELAVFNLGDAATSGDFSGATFVGVVKLGIQPVGIAASPDGKYLYVSSFQADTQSTTGLLNVLSLPKAEKNPATAVISQVAAGCHPARILVAPNSSTVWVSTRQSNYLLGYSGSKLATDPKHALVAKVLVGQTPIGLTLVKNGTRLIVADTDAKGIGPSNDNLAVLNTAKALAGQPALLGFIPSGLMPREFATSPDGQFLYVSDNGSQQVQVVPLSKIP